MAIILAVDTSDRCAHLALVRNQEEFTRSAELDRSVEQLPKLLNAVLEESGSAVAEIELLGAALGPGSFTGIRAGLAFALGLADALDLPLYGVSTLLCRGEFLLQESPELIAASNVRLCSNASTRELFCGDFHRDHSNALSPFGELRTELQGYEALAVDAVPGALALARYIQQHEAALATAASMGEAADRGAQLQHYPQQQLAPIYVKPLTAKTLKERGLA